MEPKIIDKADIFPVQSPDGLDFSYLHILVTLFVFVYLVFSKGGNTLLDRQRRRRAYYW
jgi:hypothetical protein